MLFGRFERWTDTIDPLLNILHGQIPMPQLVRFEGAMGVRKSSIARSLAPRLFVNQAPAELIEIDEGYRLSPDKWSRFIETVDVERVQQQARKILDAQRCLVVDSVCLDEVLPESEFGRGFRIYVMRLRAEYDGFWRWPYGAALERQPDGWTDTDLSVRDYHRAFQPHARADVILQLWGDDTPS